MFRFFSLNNFFPSSLQRNFISLPFHFKFASLKEFENMTNFFQKISEINSRKSLTIELKDFMTEYFKQPDKEVSFFLEQSYKFF